MDKDAIKATIKTALDEHETCHQAVKESNIDAGLLGIATAALADALKAKLARIFDPKPAGNS